MIKRFVVALVAVVVLVALVAVFFVPKARLVYKAHEELVAFINKQEEKQRDLVSRDVYGDDSKGTYGGILLAANRLGIFVWGQGKPRWFSYVSNDSVMSFFDLCRVMRQPVAEREKSVPRELFFDMPSWISKVKAGDYVLVQLNKTAKGAFKEAQVYNAWYFSDFSQMEQQCGK